MEKSAKKAKQVHALTKWLEFDLKCQLKDIENAQKNNEKRVKNATEDLMKRYSNDALYKRMDPV